MANPLVGGIFNFQGLLNDFYNWEPDGKDEAGRQQKRTFQANMIDKVANNELAIAMARENQSIATGAMKDAAALELANQKEIMADESAYGLAKMGAEYDYQSQFAKDEANRQNINDALRADLQKNQTRLEGQENRLNIESQGREERKTDSNKIKAQKFADAYVTKTKGKEDRKTIQTTGQEERQNIKTTGDQERKTVSAKGKQDRLTQADALASQEKQIKISGKQERKNIRTTGDEERKNMQQATEEDNKAAARQNRYAEKLASKF